MVGGLRAGSEDSAGGGPRGGNGLTVTDAANRDLPAVAGACGGGGRAHAGGVSLPMMKSRLCWWLGLAWIAAIAVGRAAAAPEAIVITTSDQHSSYDRTAQFVAFVDRVQAANPGVPLAVLIDGDTFEYGNVIARRSGGAVEFAMFAALARRAPTVLNIGNHETEFYDLATLVAKVQATGVTVISDAVNRATGKAFAPAVARVKLGGAEAVVVGVATDHLGVYRAEVRPSLQITDPVAWAKENLAAVFDGEPLPIVMSHAGLNADRGILPLVPDGTLFVGGHDHLRFVARLGRTLYVTSGRWNAFATIARLERDEDNFLRWEAEQVAIDPAAPGDPELAALIRKTMAENLTAEDRAIVGHTTHAMAPEEAARFAVEAVRAAAGADAALIGETTFGGGLPAGDVSAFALGDCVRFDGTICVGEIDGATLQRLFATANQGLDTPLADRQGENRVMVAPARIDPAKTYRIATTDWAMKHAAGYFGERPPVFHERPELRVKAAVEAALKR